MHPRGRERTRKRFRKKIPAELFQGLCRDFLLQNF